MKVDYTKEVDSLSVDQLKKNLLTGDFRGREFKELCLEKLLGEARQKGFDDGMAAERQVHFG